MSNYIVSDTELTATAEAARQKGGAAASGNASNIRKYFTLTDYGDYWTLTPIAGATSAAFQYMACSLKGAGAERG